MLLAKGVVRKTRGEIEKLAHNGSQALPHREKEKAAPHCEGIQTVENKYVIPGCNWREDVSVRERSFSARL
jgi:hypothetical protein